MAEILEKTDIMAKQRGDSGIEIAFNAEDLQQIEDGVGRIRELATRALFGQDADKCLREILSEANGLMALLQNGEIVREGRG